MINIKSLWMLLIYCNYCNGLNKSEKSFSSNKIMYGKTATIWDHPHQAGLEYGGIFICSLVLIHVSWSAGAAHCFKKTPKILTKGYVRLGTAYRLKGASRYLIIRVVEHPNFKKQGIPFDLSLIQSSTVQPDGFKKPIALIHPGNIRNEVGKIVEVTGYGLDENGKPSEGLRSALLEIISSWYCEELMLDIKKSFNITKTLVCAIAETGKPSIGDSGGPVVYNKKLFGIIVATGGEGLMNIINTPAIFIRISEFVAWINSVTLLKL